MNSDGRIKIRGRIPADRFVFIKGEPLWTIEERRARLRPVPRLDLLRVAVICALLAAGILYIIFFEK